MTSPKAQGNMHSAEAAGAASAVFVLPPEDSGPEGPAPAAPAARPRPALPPAHVRHGVLNVLRNRSDFLKAASARRQAAPAFLLQARDRRDGDALVRIGFTASKKVGNAVARARAKRRLRAIARAILPQSGKPGWDYVLVARPEATANHDFAAMLADLARAIEAVHRPPRPRPAPKDGAAGGGRQ